MQSYKTFLNAVRVAISNAVNKIDQRLTPAVSKAQAAADKAQVTADKAFAKAAEDESRLVSDGRVFGIERTIPSWKGNTSITEAIYPYATEMPEYAFDGCTNLKSVDLPRITSFPKFTFNDCTSLTSVNIPDGMAIFNNFVFDGCSSLMSIIIPDSVTKIDNYAFRDCTSLTSITFTGTMEQWNAIIKVSTWNENVPATEVVCSDGSVPLTT